MSGFIFNFYDFWKKILDLHVCPRDPIAHRTSEDERNGVSFLTETKRRSYSGSMKPFSGSVSQDPLGLVLATKIPKRHISQLVFLFHGDTVDGKNPANHLGCMKPCKSWDKLPINWCRISYINSSFANFLGLKKLNLSENPMKSGSRKRVWIFPTSNLNFEGPRPGEIWSDRSPSGWECWTKKGKMVRSDYCHANFYKHRNKTTKNNRFLAILRFRDPFWDG